MSGTLSMPDVPSGLQRNTRASVIQPPAHSPCRAIAVSRSSAMTASGVQERRGSHEAIVAPAVIGGEVRATRYVPAGRDRELAQAARDAIGPDASAVLLANHGVVAGGRDLAEAVVAAQIVERAAMIFIQSEAIGGATQIAEQHWRGQRARYLDGPSKPEPPQPTPPRPFPASHPATQEPPV